jgi:hypothetical protein
MMQLNHLRIFQIRNRSACFENPIISPTRQPELRNRRFEQVLFICALHRISQPSAPTSIVTQSRLDRMASIPHALQTLGLLLPL